MLLEVEWVLRFAYKFSPAQICQAFNNLFGLSNVYLSNANLIAQVLDWHQSGLDFADAFHFAQSQHCSGLYTFNKSFLIKAQDLTECELRQL